MTYENVLDTDGKTVKQIKINGFLVPVFSIEDGVAKVEFVKSEEAADFAFAPKREVLTYKNVFMLIENGIKTKKYYSNACSDIRTFLKIPRFPKPIVLK